MNALEIMKQQAPATAAMLPAISVSDRYAFISTIDMAKELMRWGWEPASARQTRSLHRETARHLVRFRNPGLKTQFRPGELVLELLLENSHNGRCSLRFLAGLWRVLCGNGLVAGVLDLGKLMIRHVGSPAQVATAAAQASAARASEIFDVVKTAKTIELTEFKAREFAVAASTLAWPMAKSRPEAVALLKPRRKMDEASDLWTTFNVIQENLTRGGIGFQQQFQMRRGQPRTRNAVTREVKGIARDTNLNEGLWELMKGIIKRAA